MQKRGQAATEFLTTYGWAILILAIIIGIIFGLNLFNPKAQNNCVASEPISCDDIKYSATNGLSLILTASGVSSTVTDTQVTQIKINNPIRIICATITGNSGVSLPDNVQTSVQCNTWDDSVLAQKMKEDAQFSGVANITYKLPGSINSYQSKVIFSGTVEE